MHPKETAILTTTRSDSHTWNLVYMDLWLREQGLDVVNLGSCVPIDVVVNACRQTHPGLLIVSSVNGHGGIEGLELIRQVRSCEFGRHLLTVIGGKLTTSPTLLPAMANRLRTAGFDAVLTGDAAIGDLARLIESLRREEAA